MKENIFFQVEKIAAAFSVRNRVIYFGKKETGIRIDSNSPVKQIARVLSDFIYDNCYVRCKFGPEPEEYSGKTYTESERTTFLNNLDESNKIVDSFDYGWTVDDTSETGSVLTMKKEYQMIAGAGDFLKQFQSNSNVAENDRIIIPVLKEPIQKGAPFYFITGIKKHNWWNSGSARFYWNLKPEGAGILVGLISEKFNRFGIPFGFKCLTDPDSYNRCDSAVLYLASCYFTTGVILLKEIHSSISEFLNNDVPLFTLKLSKGISFAENPPWINISFGQSRCQIIAGGLLKAWNENVSADKISEKIKQSIIESDLNPEKFYLNPRSFFEYDFSCFNSSSDE